MSHAPETVLLDAALGSCETRLRATIEHLAALQTTLDGEIDRLSGLEGALARLPLESPAAPRTVPADDTLAAASASVVIVSASAAEARSGAAANSRPRTAATIAAARLLDMVDSLWCSFWFLGRHRGAASCRSV